MTNDVTLQIATANGSGSQSSNTVLLRSLFQMGIPVSGKNLFPSNIAGLPTWYTIRASKDGYVARKKEVDLLVAMNPETARDDVAGLPPGAVVVYDAPLALEGTRADLVYYPVAFDKVVEPITGEARLRKLLRNMAYVGVVARLLDIEMAEVEAAIDRVFGEKAKARELNVAAARAGFAQAEGLERRHPHRVARMDATRGKIVVDGNAACALGAMFAGFAGSFFATRQGFISPESFTFIESATILAIVVLGGLGSQLGVALASIALIGGFELLRNMEWLQIVFGQDFDPSLYRMLLFGLAMVVIMLWRPRGIVSSRTPSILLEPEGGAAPAKERTA
jgi:Pyruvate/2-oxoacid:ferredoxin oxidoreductase gamma subunit